MPTSTFFNLPPPKRERLLRAAVEEFSRKPFGEASINRIVQKAEISRGSFYQYFYRQKRPLPLYHGLFRRTAGKDHPFLPGCL